MGSGVAHLLDDFEMPYKMAEIILQCYKGEISIHKSRVNGSSFVAQISEEKYFSNTLAVFQEVLSDSPNKT